MCKIYNTGMFAATSFGHEVTGLNNTQLSIVAGPKCATRSRTLNLILIGDPPWKVALSPA